MPRTNLRLKSRTKEQGGGSSASLCDRPQLHKANLGAINEDLNLNRLAAQAGWSKLHFHRLFKSAMTFHPLAAFAPSNS